MCRPPIRTTFAEQDLPPDLFPVMHEKKGTSVLPIPFLTDIVSKAETTTYVAVGLCIRRADSIGKASGQSG